MSDHFAFIMMSNGKTVQGQECRIAHPRPARSSPASRRPDLRKFSDLNFSVVRELLAQSEIIESTISKRLRPARNPAAWRPEQKRHRRDNWPHDPKILKIFLAPNLALQNRDRPEKCRGIQREIDQARIAHAHEAGMSDDSPACARMRSVSCSRSRIARMAFSFRHRSAIRPVKLDQVLWPSDADPGIRQTARWPVGPP